MPIHDWARVPSGLFHHFHQDWSIEIARRLNRGLLPKGVSALVEQRTGPREADVLTVERGARDRHLEPDGGSKTTTLVPPSATIVRRISKQIDAGRANRIAVRHHLGRIIAVIEIVSPGNKDGRAALRDFVEESMELLRQGVHLLVIDLFPPPLRDPFGIH